MNDFEILEEFSHIKIEQVKELNERIEILESALSNACAKLERLSFLYSLHNPDYRQVEYKEWLKWCYNE